MDISGNIKLFRDGSGKSGGRKPQERYASFDYCYNYFQSFRESGNISDLKNSQNIQTSCLHLGFYLASWGMLRGSSFLLEKSAKFYQPLIETVAEPSKEWLDSFDTQHKEYARNGFYFWKIWFIESDTNDFQILTAFSIFEFERNNQRNFSLKYGHDNPTIAYSVSRENNQRTIRAYFPLNNCLFSPDYNRDGKLDLQDVQIAIKNKMHN